MKDEVGERKSLDPSMPKWKPVPHTRTRRIIEGTAAVAVWMCMGFVFHLSGNAYLLLGIPITIIFQKYVRRAPLRAMWVRDAPPFYLGKMGVAFAILLMIRPLMDLVRCIRLHASWVLGACFVAAILGAWAAAYALCYFRRETGLELLLCTATAGVVGSAIIAAVAFTRAASHEPAWSRVHTGVVSLLQNVPVTFLLEEVWFRGVLDSHLHHPGEARGAQSAIYVSALWGLWHYPILPGPHSLGKLLPTLASLLLVHVSIGVLFSWSWRRSGNLFVPASVHALIDAVRNALIGLPA